ncbi:MAG: methyltransferase [Anaerofustis stercorihominis]|nr:methyltransferase [Anaerofustis stercorihominis]
MERVKFCACEIEGAEIKKPVSNIENLLEMAKTHKPLWMPMSNEYKFFAPRIDPDNVARAFVIDIAEPKLTKEEQGGKDMFGIEWEYVPVAGGSMVRPGQPLMEDANDWKEFIKFPNVNEWDWAGCAEANKAFVEGDIIPAFTMLNGFMFERLISFMEFENAAMAVIDDDQVDAVKELLDKITTEVYIPYLENIAKYFPTCKMIWIHDDWGAQRSPFFSEATAMDVLVPNMQKFVAKAHELGMFVQFHSCGANEMLIEAYKATGVDMWQGMGTINDFNKLYKAHGFNVTVELPAEAMKEEVTEEEAAAIAKAFCEEFIVNGEVNAVVQARGVNPVVLKHVYKVSREMLNA